MKVLLTGATGFLGQELCQRLRASGHEVLGLSRHGPDLFGDITKPNLGLESPPHVDALIHSAALLSFSEKDHQRLFEVNALGTYNVCRFCVNNHIPRLTHISTVYICGNHRGIWREDDFDLWQTPRNPYEATKFQAELIARSYPNLKVTIIRPGIIAGRSTDGKATTFEGFYAPIRAIAKVMNLMERRIGLPPREDMEKKLHLPPLWVPLSIKGDPHSTLNVVPVDWVVDRIIDLLSTEGTFHLTNPHPPTNEEILKWACDTLGITGPHFDLHAKLRQPLDMLYARMTRDFSPYLQYEPTFATSISPSTSLTNDNKGFIMKAIRYWRGVKV